MKRLTARSLTEEIDNKLLTAVRNAMPGKYYTYLICASLTRWLTMAWVVFFVGYLGITLYLKKNGMDFPKQAMSELVNILLVGFCVFIVARIISGAFYEELTAYINNFWINEGNQHD